MTLLLILYFFNALFSMINTILNFRNKDDKAAFAFFGAMIAWFCCIVLIVTK